MIPGMPRKLPLPEGFYRMESVPEVEELAMQPDGKLVVIVSKELAYAWDPSDAPEQTYTYALKDIRGWTEQFYGLQIRYANDSEQYKSGCNRVVIPWAQVLYYEVFTNSEEYIMWAKLMRPKEVHKLRA
jgi:hypothetical protein